MDIESNDTRLEAIGDGFVLDVLDAATLLGVSRTRLSQLTSRGVFSYQRRKIGIRNRLFYKRSELLNYLHGHTTRFAGATAASHSPLSTVQSTREATGVSQTFDDFPYDAALHGHVHDRAPRASTDVQSGSRRKSLAKQRQHAPPALVSARQNLATDQRDTQIQALQTHVCRLEDILQEHKHAFEIMSRKLQTTSKQLSQVHGLLIKRVQTKETSKETNKETNKETSQETSQEICSEESAALVAFPTTSKPEFSCAKRRTPRALCGPSGEPTRRRARRAIFK